MLDPNFIKDNLKKVKENIAARCMQVDADKAVSLYESKKKLLTEVEKLRQQRNDNAARMKTGLTPQQRTELIAAGKKLKKDISACEARLQQLEPQLQEVMSAIPNMSHPDVPPGKEEKDNLELHRQGDIPVFTFQPLDHVKLGSKLDILDFETAASISGPKFYFLKNQGAFLELALIRFAMDKLNSLGFSVTITPDIAKEKIVKGIGFNPRGPESNIYNIENSGKCLVGTAEITLGGVYSDKIIDLSAGPLLLAGFSHCFRQEAGAAGRFSHGLYRVHQFSKVEMFVYCTPEQSDQLHEKLRTIEEEIFTDLEIPYRVVDTCSGDLGAPAYRKYDLEAWMPGRGKQGGWGEVTSTSNCTDYQARRLNIRFKDSKGQNRYVHMLNGTAVAVSRAIIAILENRQREDGSVSIPAKLSKYTGFTEIKPSQ